MKKFLLPLVAMLFCMTACNKDNEGILKLEVEQYASNNKLHLDDDNYAVWDNEDAVWVNGTTYEVSVSNTSASLTGVAEATSYQAVYPASWASTDGTTIAYPETQNYRTNGTVQVVDAPMAAYSTGNGTLKFSNLGSILAVNVTNNTAVDVAIDAIKVTADGTTLLNGTATIDYANGTISSLSSGTSTTTLNLVDANTGNGVTIAKESTKTFYIALPPTTAKLTIKVQSGVWERSLSQGQAHAFEASCGYNAPFNFTPANKQLWYTADAQVSSSALSPSSNNFNNGKGVMTFASDITSIPTSAFSGLSLTSITLPSSVTSIEQSAFSTCTSLASAYMPNVETIGGRSFSSCSQLTSADMLNVTSIGEFAFYHTGLTSADIPSVTTIERSAFNGCTALASVNMPNVETVNTSAFNGCTALVSANMPKVKTIGSLAFEGCTSLASVYVSDKLTSINNDSFSSCPITDLYYNRQSAPGTLSSIKKAKFNCNSTTGKTLHVPSGRYSYWTSWWGGTIVDDIQ